ncbi:uncharacterized protein LOC113385746 [Ctenocephalides felis]|uniref:uncharacterized protein LOC113385746 n=1 Tax=Ctenocephalides felis TaxID=7515 RepID=UPI000E6E2F7E|nr:uncharacterized protein LOC113385746 [Ctenocephalides felis]
MCLDKDMFNPTSFYFNLHMYMPTNASSDWSVEDKTTFLRVVKEYGLSNMYQICKALPNHSKGDIEIFIRNQMKLRSKYKQIVSIIQRSQRPARVSKRNRDKSCIDLWIDLLLKYHMDIPRYFNPIAFSMQLISDFGVHNSGSEEDVDFKKIYLYISQALQGVNPCQLNKNTDMFLRKILADLAKEHEDESKFIAERSFVSEIKTNKISLKKVKIYETHTDSLLANIKNIQEDRELNPLDVPLEMITDET